MHSQSTRALFTSTLTILILQPSQFNEFQWKSQRLYLTNNPNILVFLQCDLNLYPHNHAQNIQLERLTLTFPEERSGGGGLSHSYSNDSSKWRCLYWLYWRSMRKKNSRRRHFYHTLSQGNDTDRVLTVKGLKLDFHLTLSKYPGR